MMDLSNIKNSIEEYNLFNHSDRLLLACSGGIDSMLLAHALLYFKYNFAIAHIDHQTRNGQSTKDALFVQEFCTKNNIEVYIKKINIEVLKSESKNSFQEEARNQRYLFFNQLVEEHGFSKVLIGHHKNDSIETFFINLARGSGIKGLKGISVSRDNIVRPLINLDKNQILAIAKSHSIEYRNDSSNLKNDYQRNYLRNKIIPELETWNKGINHSILKSMKHLNEVNEFVEHALLSWKKKMVKRIEDRIVIKLNHITNSEHASFILYSILQKYSFNKNQTSEIILASQVGKTWKSVSHTAYLERNNVLHIAENRLTDKPETYSFGSLIPGIGKLVCSQLEQKNYINYIELDKKIDLNKLEIRSWKDGDYMQTQIGKKKIKKIYQELKIPNVEKNKKVLLTHKSEVLWIIGIKKSYVKTPSTNKVYLLIE